VEFAHGAETLFSEQKARAWEKGVVHIVHFTYWERRTWKMPITFDAIGFVETDVENVPRHWTISALEGRLVMEKQYLGGLKDIAKGQQIVAIFHFHHSPKFNPENLVQTPRHLKKPRGVFSICSPLRPNPIGMSVLTVIKRTKNIIHVKGLDMENGTPLLDIKPYVPDEKYATDPKLVRKTV
jgi:tRNA-Thr(GGU) m(6)t(6)A37 methyltransferase TsaA